MVNNCTYSCEYCGVCVVGHKTFARHKETAKHILNEKNANRFFKKGFEEGQKICVPLPKSGGSLSNDMGPVYDRKIPMLNEIRQHSYNKKLDALNEEIQTLKDERDKFVDDAIAIHQHNNNKTRTKKIRRYVRGGSMRRPYRWN